MAIMLPEDEEEHLAINDLRQFVGQENKMGKLFYNNKDILRALMFRNDMFTALLDIHFFDLSSIEFYYLTIKCIQFAYDENPLDESDTDKKLYCSAHAIEIYQKLDTLIDPRKVRNREKNIFPSIVEAWQSKSNALRKVLQIDQNNEECNSALLELEANRPPSIESSQNEQRTQLESIGAPSIESSQKDQRTQLESVETSQNSQSASNLAENESSNITTIDVLEVPAGVVRHPERRRTALRRLRKKGCMIC